MHTRFLDVLHDPHHDAAAAVGDRVDVDLGGVFEEAVDQHRLAIGGDEGLGDVAIELGLVVADLHRAAAEHETRTHQRGEADPFDFHPRLGHVARDAAGRLPQAELVDQFLEQLAIFGRFNGFDARPDDRHAGFLQPAGEVQRRLATKLHDHAIGLDRIADIQHVFDGERFEEQHVAGVVVGADRFGIAVDHHAFVAEFAKCEAGVTAAVIELNPLADAVGATAENHHPFLVARWRQFVFGFVGAVVVGRVGLELGRAGVDALEHRFDAEFDSPGADLHVLAADQPRDLAIREATAFGAAKIFGGPGAERADGGDPLFFLDDLLHVVQEPAIDVRQLIDLVQRHAGFDRVPHVENALRAGDAQPRPQFIFIGLLVRAPQIALVAAQTKGTHFQPPQRLLQRLLEGSPDRHRLADALHLRHQRRVGFRELLKREPGNLGDHVVDRRFEARLRLLRDVVGQFPQAVADGQFGGDFGDRKSGRLAGQRATSRDSRIHLDHDHLAGVRMDRELDVGATGFDTDLADHGQRRVAHPLVLFVRERLGGRHGDRVAGVHAHGIEVFDAADDHDVVIQVAHHLHLVFFPADDRLFDQDFVNRTLVEAVLNQRIEVGAVVGDR